MCQTCSCVFTSRANLQHHMMSHAQPDQLQCYLCDQKFETPDKLERHFSEHIEESTPLVPLPPKYLDQPGTPRQQFRCGTCDIVFDSPVVFSQHLQCHQKQFPSDTTPEDVGLTATSATSGGQLQCHTCGVMCDGYEDLQKHMLARHTPEPRSEVEKQYNDVRRSSPPHMEQQTRTWTPPQQYTSPRMSPQSHTSPRMVSPDGTLEGGMAVKQETGTPHSATGIILR